MISLFLIWKFGRGSFDHWPVYNDMAVDTNRGSEEIFLEAVLQMYFYEMVF